MPKMNVPGAKPPIQSTPVKPAWAMGATVPTYTAADIAANLANASPGRKLRVFQHYDAVALKHFPDDDNGDVNIGDRCKVQVMPNGRFILGFEHTANLAFCFDAKEGVDFKFVDDGQQGKTP